MHSDEAGEEAAVSRGDWVAGAAAFLAPLALFVALVPYGLELADEGHLIHQIDRTYRGELPYVDFHTGYTPAMYYFNAAVLHLSGASLLAVRGCLAVLNAFCAYGIFRLSRRLRVSSPAALAVSLVYVALIPFHDGRFTPLNIPYPSWYVTPFWLIGVMCLIRWWEGGARRWLLLGGACAGVVFAFKPNAGLLNLAVLLLAVTLLERPAEGGAPAGRFDRLVRRAERLGRPLVPLVLAVGLWGVVAPGGARLFWLLLAPMLLPAAAALFGSRPYVTRPVEPGTVARNLVLIGMGFAVPTLPWVVFFMGRMGLASFFRSVFFIGTGFEQHYLIQYPPVGRWLVIMVVAFAGMGILAGALRRGWVGRRLLLAGGALVVGAAVVRLIRNPPPMVEGLQPSVAMRVQDVSFGFFLAIMWTALAVHFYRGYRRAPAVEEGRIGTGTRWILLMSAALMHMQMYPRSDYMHLVNVLPGLLVIAGWLLERIGRNYAECLARTAGGRRFVMSCALAPLYGLSAILLAPAAYRAAYVVRTQIGDDESALVRLDSARAPLVIEPAAGGMLRSLSAVLRFLRERTRPGEPIFTFPCLDYLVFLADLPEATRHGYYFPGSPGHAVEAEVVDDLERKAPNYVVVLQDHVLFFVGAPAYYFSLREYVTRHYRVDSRLGLVAVLRRADGAEGGSEASEVVATGGDGGSAPGEAEKAEVRLLVDGWVAELRNTGGAWARKIRTALESRRPESVSDLADVIGRLDPDEQWAVAKLVRKSRYPAGGAALAWVLAAAEVPDRVFQVFVRVIGELGDIRAAKPLVEAIAGGTPERSIWMAGQLFHIAGKEMLREYWYVPPEAGSRDTSVPADMATRLVRWMDNPWEWYTLRYFSAYAVRHAADRVALPFLMRAVGDPGEDPGVRMAAAQSLTALGFGPQIVKEIGRLVRHNHEVGAPVLVRLYDENPEAGRAALRKLMTADELWLRRKAMWMAAGVRDSDLLDLMLLGLEDSDIELRTAAVWALGRMDAPGVEEALQRAAGDARVEVAEFARRALARRTAPQ